MNQPVKVFRGAAAVALLCAAIIAVWSWAYGEEGAAAGAVLLFVVAILAFVQFAPNIRFLREAPTVLRLVSPQMPTFGCIAVAVLLTLL